MSVSKKQLEQKRLPNGKQTSRSTGGNGSFTSVTLDKEEVKDMVSQNMALEDWFAVFDNYLDDGFKLTVQFDGYNSCMVARLHSPADDWRQSRILTYHHPDPQKCLIGLAYGLSHRYANYHLEKISPLQMDFGW